MAGSADAGLSRADKGAESGVVDGLFEIIILEHDDRRLASEFERLACEIRGRRRAGEAAGLRAACEHQLANAGMAGQGLAGHRAIAGDDVEDPRRKAGFRKDLRQPHRGERRVFRRLDDGRAAGCKGRGKVAAGDQQRMIEGCDIGNNTDGKPLGIGEVVPLDRNDVVAFSQRQPRIVPEKIGDAGKLRPRLADRPAIVQCLELIEFLEMVLHDIGKFVNQAGAGAHRHLGPVRRAEGPCRALHRCIDVSLAGQSHFFDDVAIGRRTDIHQLPV